MTKPSALFLAVLLTTAGCAGEDLDLDLDLGTAEQQACGDCNPHSSNAQGVINIEKGQSCVLTNDLGPLCPLAFVSRPALLGGGVSMIVHDDLQTQSWKVPVSATYNGAAVTLFSVNAPQTAASVTYIDAQGQKLTASGSSLASFIFSFSIGLNTIQLRLQLPFEQPSNVNGVWEHPLRARLNNGAWSSLCKDQDGVAEPASLLWGAWFDPLTAKRDAQMGTVMVSCKKGGITTCMEWGFKPWESKINEQTQQSESLVDAHVSCIQMKRAAYCGTEAWTEPGTPISIDDRYNVFQNFPLAHLEALWSPSGAVCTDPSNFRHKELNFNNLCNGQPIPSCGNFADEQAMWTQWGAAHMADGVSPLP